MEFRACSDDIQVTAAEIVPQQPFTARESISRHCEACVQAEGGHFENLF
jgi:hypothetical protein